MGLDAPRVQLFCVRPGPELSGFRGAPDVIREGAENGTRGRVRSPSQLRFSGLDFRGAALLDRVQHGERE